MTELHSRIGEASHRFLEEIHTVDQQHPFEVSAEEMVALPESVPACPSLSVRGGGTVALGQAALDGILFGCSSAEVRRRALVHHEQVAQSSLPILEELLGARHELAATLGARSFAEHALSNRVMQSPEAAMEFLRDLHGGLQPKIRQEVELLQREKAAVEGPNSGVVEESDRRYMCRRVKERLSPDGPSVTLGSCMKVLHFLTSSLWGVSLELVPLRRGEHCSPDVLKVRVTEESPEGGSARHLADVYMDLFSRSHKIGTTAAYVQQFPQHLYPQPPGVSFDQSTNDDDMHQEWSPARVTLVCHMPRAASRPVMLPLSAAETLWHEWGHVLHVVLSRTRYQHTAGTRCALDFVEMPSTLMEAFFWDPRVLAMLDRSWSPSDLRALGARRLLFSGLEAQHQIFLAMADLQLHGADPRSVDLPSSLRRVHAEFRDSPLVPRMNVAQFSHLSGYAAGYYGYLLSKVLSS
ncbi:MAG: M3 family metallopeptidase, partial [archaeon]|nr:M3 family metallopeptidase [archaeon]